MGSIQTVSKQETFTPVIKVSTEKMEGIVFCFFIWTAIKNKKPIKRTVKGKVIKQAIIGFMMYKKIKQIKQKNQSMKYLCTGIFKTVHTFCKKFI